MNILFCFDQKYEQHFGVALTSLLLNNTALSIDLYIVTDVASQQLINNLNQLQRNQQLAAYKIYEVNQDDFSGVKVSLHISQAAYYRLMVANLLPDTLDKVLYLDSDLVVISSLETLYATNVTDYYLAAYGNHSRTFQKRLKLKDGLYFNSGVMLINLKKWREDKIGEKSLEFVKKNLDILKNWDQDALNKVVDGQIVRLDNIWNFLVDLGREKLKETSKKNNNNHLKIAKIVHFVGSSKPWYFWINNSQKDIYWSYLQQSLWHPSKLNMVFIQLGYIRTLLLRKIREYSRSE
jgi:UDP-glucose/galactose:(glucosyl)LPS alpha-1,2-glucosyl/galactosyltransferase